MLDHSGSRSALVTGADGFVGRHLVRRLVVDGWTVAALTRRVADLTDPVAASAAVRAADPDVVFSLAAARAARTPDERAAMVAVNTSPWLVDALGPRGRRVVRLGSSTEYAGRAAPLDEDAALSTESLFGATKATGSLLLLAQARRRGIGAVVLRAFQVYGAGDHRSRLVPAVLHAARTGSTVPLTAPGLCRDWVWVGDVVDACVRAATVEVDAGGLVCNIGTGVQTPNEGVVAAAERVTGRRIGTEPGAHPGRHWDSAHWVADVRRARTMLGWTPTTDLETGLARTWAAEYRDARTGSDTADAAR